MKHQLLAEFPDPDSLKHAVGQVRESGYGILDAFTPFPVEGLESEFETKGSPIRTVMLLGGLACAAFAYVLQWYSSVYGYPINSGGRPLHSWPVFLLVPFEVGVFGAAFAGLVAFFWTCGLPRLHDPVFAVPGFERASQDRFFLLAEAAGTDQARNQLRHLLERAGAVVVTEVPTS
jgi:hypothetical protein